MPETTKEFDAWWEKNKTKFEPVCVTFRAGPASDAPIILLTLSTALQRELLRARHVAVRESLDLVQLVAPDVDVRLAKDASECDFGAVFQMRFKSAYDSGTTWDRPVYLSVTGTCSDEWAVLVETSIPRKGYVTARDPVLWASTEIRDLFDGHVCEDFASPSGRAFSSDPSSSAAPETPALPAKPPAEITDREALHYAERAHRAAYGVKRVPWENLAEEGKRGFARDAKDILTRGIPGWLDRQEGDRPEYRVFAAVVEIEHEARPLGPRTYDEETDLVFVLAGRERVARVPRNVIEQAATLKLTERSQVSWSVEMRTAPLGMSAAVSPLDALSAMPWCARGSRAVRDAFLAEAPSGYAMDLVVSVVKDLTTVHFRMLVSEEGKPDHVHRTPAIPLDTFLTRVERPSP